MTYAYGIAWYTYSYNFIMEIIVPQRSKNLSFYVDRRAASEYPDLAVQLDVFDEQRESDEAQILDAPYGVDLNSHLDVFYAILRQVSSL